MDRIIIRTIKFLMMFLKEKHVFVQKKFTDSIAVDVYSLPIPKTRTKITILKLIRLDGCSLSEALETYNTWFME